MAFCSFNPQDHFKSIYYAGNSTNGRAITGVGFQPAIVWIKSTDNANWQLLFDAVQGEGKGLAFSESAAQRVRSATTQGYISSFDSDGFTLNADSDNQGTNYSGTNYIAYCWKGGTTSGITTNGSTTITPSSYNFNQTAGISVIEYTGNNTNGAKIAHGLGTAPSLIWIKRKATVENWIMYHRGLGNTHFLVPNINESPSSGHWNSTDPDTVNFTVANSDFNNGDGDAYIAYCFAEKKGFFKTGSLKGNGGEHTEAGFHYTGFTPSLLMTKANNAYSWHTTNILLSTAKDYSSSARFPDIAGNPIDYYLDSEDTATLGSTGTSRDLNFVSNGFKFKGDGSEMNGNNVQTYWWAWGHNPMVCNDVPALAR